MSIKSVYLSRKRLEELRDSLKDIDEELYNSLNDYLECGNCDGEYLINIFNGYELYKLNIIDENYKLFDDVDTILKAK